MYNSPALDIAIGLVFIFLLYSLLATSVQEAIATFFSMRATMLKRSIVENMLADTPDVSLFKGMWNDIAGRLRNLLIFFQLKKKNGDSSLGNQFYAHPIIKNYGESRVFPLPAYIPKDNFSSVLIDIFLKDFNDNIAGIAQMNLEEGRMQGDIDSIKAELSNLRSAFKIKELVRFHIQAYANDENYEHFIHSETCQIIEMHLRNAKYDLSAFSKNLEGWFDDSMHRVSGWYKRQTQFILFVIGLVLAFIFNVDVIEISGKLSTDKDARDKLVTLAVKASDAYKDDPRVQQMNAQMAKSGSAPDSMMVRLEDIKREYNQHIDAAKKTMDTDIKEANNLLTGGWKAYGQNDFKFLEKLKNDDGWKILSFRFGGFNHYWKTSQTKLLADELSLHREKNRVVTDSLTKLLNGKEARQKPLEKRRILKMLTYTKARFDYKVDSLQYAAFYNTVIETKPKSFKARYMWYAIGPTKLLGFIIFAFGICLGAPFWFDLLNKLIKIRGSEKNGSNGDNGNGGNARKTAATTGAAPTQPIAITVNNQSNGEEAVG